MEPNEIQTALEPSVAEVLETMCFASVFESAEGIPISHENGQELLMSAELEFEGSSSGRFRVSATAKLARVLGAGFLGREEEELSDSHAEEVLCEISNMICGSVLGRLDSNAIFKLGHPRIVPHTPDRGVGYTASRRWFDTGDGILTVSFER